MSLYLAAFAMPSAHHHHDHDHKHEGCCGGTGEHPEGEECCGGSGHHAEGEGCCGKHDHSEPETGFEAFSKAVSTEYPDFLALFDGLWLINSDKNHQDIYKSLKHTVDSHSALWIIPLPKDSAGFLKPDALEWIQPRLYPKK